MMVRMDGCWLQFFTDFLGRSMMTWLRFFGILGSGYTATDPVLGRNRLIGHCNYFQLRPDRTCVVPILQGDSVSFSFPSEFSG